MDDVHSLFRLMCHEREPDSDPLNWMPGDDLFAVVSELAATSGPGAAAAGFPCLWTIMDVVHADRLPLAFDLTRVHLDRTGSSVDTFVRGVLGQVDICERAAALSDELCSRRSRPPGELLEEADRLRNFAERVRRGEWMRLV